MRRGRIFIYLALILLVGLVALFLVVQLFLSRTKVETTTPAPPMISIIVAAQPIPQGAEITEEALGVISIPRDSFVEAMFSDEQRDQVVGKIARYQIEQGIVITRGLIAEPGTELALAGPRWATAIPFGMTAISIPTTRLSSVAYGVADGAHVNVTACLLLVDVDPSFQSVLPNNTAVVTGAGLVPDQPPILSAGVQPSGEGAMQGRLELEPSLQQPFYVTPSESQRPRLVCQMILQDVLVLHLGDFATGAAAQTTGQEGGAGAPPPEGGGEAATSPDIVTLVVSPQDSVTLSYLLYSGAKLTLTLRNTSDQSRMDIEAATLQYLLSQYNIPVPAKLPYAIEPRIDRLVEPGVITPGPEQ
ncbi:MAG: hypothetical protein D6770_01990 [Anaerolineae bacterium]|nr:MAG: hypothetical protein D6770_01990 [Anaerolineae bacterium]